METNNKIDNPVSGREKRRSTFAVLFYVNRTKIRKDGMCQLLCKISIDAESEQVGTKVSVDPTLWNPETGRAKGKSRNAQEVNRAIDLLTEKISTHYAEIRKSLGFVTAELVKNALKGHAQKAHTLMKLFEEHNNEFKNRIGIDRVRETHRCYLRTYALLLEFLQKKYEVDDISLKNLNLTFMDEFDFFLRKDYQMKQKTISDHIITLKKMTRRAVSQGTLRRDPYMTYHPEQPAKKSHHQKVEDLQRIMQCNIENPTLQRIRDWFVFSTFTGLAYTDLKRFSVEHLKQAEDGSWWIHIERRKTKTECHIRLLEVPLQIIEKYRHERKSDLIFNLYDRSYTCTLIHKLEKICGIGRITFHMSRHNFGTHITLSQGVPIETVSRMMGHTSITTTQIYAKVTDTKVEEDMKRLKERTGEKEIRLHEDEKLRAAIRFPRKNKKREMNQTTNQEL